MNTPLPTAIFEKLGQLERDLQRLKVQAYFALPRERRARDYPELAIRRAVKQARAEIWRSRYAGKIARFP